MARILCAEDDPDIAVLVEFKLAQAGHDVTVVEDGAAALDALNGDGAFELLVLDVMMPKIDGFEVARVLRREGHELPILMLTARSREADVESGFDAGVDDYLSKPFSTRELLSRVERLLRR